LRPSGVHGTPKFVRRGLVLWLEVLLIVSCFSQRADAAPCGAEGHPWVLVVFEWESRFQRFEATVIADLRAGFAGRDIDVCLKAGGPAHPPLATVELSSTERRSRVGVEIRDTVTDKRVGRDVELENVPEDGQAFAIALATDELVWASWAELALERRLEPKAPPPPQVKQAIAKKLPPAPVRPRPRVSISAAGERYGGRQRQLGLDGGLLLPLTVRLKLDLGVGVRQGLEEQAANGNVRSNAAGFSVGGRYLLSTSRKHELALGLSFQTSLMSLRGEPEAGAAAEELRGVVAFGRSSVAFDVHLGGPIWLSTAVHGGVPVRGLEATADGKPVTGASSWLLGAQVGVSVEL
jgi:hypothetical protein